MRSRNQLIKLFLAVLPLWSYGEDFIAVMTLAALTVVMYWTSAAILKVLTRFLPAPYVKYPFLLWLAFLAESAFSVSPFSGIWAVSVLILLPDNFWNGKIPAGFIRSAVLTGGIYWLLLLYFASCVRILKTGFGIESFASPAGAFLMLAVAAWALQSATVRESENV